MSTSYFMNIGAYVATVIFAAARLAVGGVLTEPGALVPALLVLGILLIPLASKGGFQKSTYQTGPAFGLAWGVLYALTPAQLSSDRISGVLEASREGLSFSFKDNLAVFCIGLLLLVGLSAVRKYFPNAALNVLRYAILTLMQLLAFEGMFRYLLDAQSARQLWLFVPPVLFSGLFLARELRDGEEKSRLRICVLASVLYAFLTPVVLAAVSSGWSDLCSRVGKLTHLGWPMVAGAVLLAALTLEKGAQKQSIYRAARLLVWAAYILLLNWRAGAMRLDADDCWLISVLGVPVAGAVYELLEQKGQGLNLTWEVRNGILNHRTSGHPATLEGNVVRLSDKIAYINHDIDDAIRGKIMKEEDLPREYTDILGNSVHERLNIMIHDIIEHSQDKPEVAMSPEREEAMHGLRRWMFDHVYHDGIAKAEEGRAQQMIEMLYGYYMAHPEELPEESHRIMEIRNETKERAVCDYIAGMTDIYAIDRFKELFIPKAWSV